jgi:3-oxoacyl-[acyl-carrier-protein] synthase-1
MKIENSPNDVVVTGTGVCCNMGDDQKQIESNLRNGLASNFEIWPTAVEYGARCHLAGLYPGDVSDAALEISKKQGRFMGRASRMALRAAKAALEMSKIEHHDLAVVTGSGTGDVDAHRATQTRLEKTHKTTKISPTIIPQLMSSTVSANLANVLRMTGPSFSASAACAGGTYNILLAATLLQNGHAKAALAGGTEAVDLHFFAGFDSMRALNSGDNENPSRASRPYAADRGGFIIGEGAGMLVMELRHFAEARGAEILGVIHGCGMSSDGTGEMVAPSSGGAVSAMRQALEQAKCPSSAIDYVNTHGTSTPLGDVTEVRAIREVFDERHVPYSSTKGYTGHPISAAGSLEAIFSLWMLRGNWIAPCLHADVLDPELSDFAPVRTVQDIELELALSNSLGFGGTNAALILGAPS